MKRGLLCVWLSSRGLFEFCVKDAETGETVGGGPFWPHEIPKLIADACRIGYTIVSPQEIEAPK